MGMKIRIVIMEPDHKNDIFILKKKKLEGKKFTHKNCAYLIDSDHFQITTDSPWWRLWMFKRYFTTYYYTAGQTNPLPVPNFAALTDETKSWEGLIGSEELAALFNPWFYRIIGAPVNSVLDQMQLYATLGTLCAVLYVAWTVHQGQTAEAAQTALLQKILAAQGANHG